MKTTIKKPVEQKYYNCEKDFVSGHNLLSSLDFDDQEGISMDDILN